MTSTTTAIAVATAPLTISAVATGCSSAANAAGGASSRGVSETCSGLSDPASNNANATAGSMPRDHTLTA